jgi:hypothetical protein
MSHAVVEKIRPKHITSVNHPCIFLLLEMLNNLWKLGTEYRNSVVVPARQATQPGGIGSLESILGLFYSLKNSGCGASYK